MRIIKNKWFSRFARKERIADSLLKEVIDRAEGGLVDADLGGHIIKQRIARPGGGRSGGYRTIIVFRSKDVAFFVFGFAKNERDNLDADELKAFKEAAKELLALDEAMLQSLIADGTLTEIETDV